MYPNITFAMNEERNGVQIYIDGEKGRVLYDGDNFIIISERINIRVTFVDNIWNVYFGDELCGYFKFVSE